MFEKLLSVLPYNPGLSHQVAFYSRRMREEAAIRRIGVIFIVLAFMVQFMAVLSPPQPTTAASNNDLINGGISSATDAQRHCNQNTQRFGAIVQYFGISCADIGRADTVNISSNGKNYYSMGRLPQGAHNDATGRATNETAINIPGPQGKVYVRLLDSWGTTSYKALRVQSSVTGQWYFILYDCGNLVSVGPPAPPNYCKWDSSILASNPKCYKPCAYDKNLPANSPRCFKPCQFKPNIPASSPQCFKPCPINGLHNLPQSSPKCAKPCPYNKKINANNPKCFKPCPYNKKIPADSPKCFKPCKYNNDIPSNSNKCKPCENASKSNPFACVVIHKIGSNITQEIPDANETTANPGDTITYTLSAQNTGKADVKNYVFTENLSDVLDYADVTDLHGGKMDANQNVSWPAQTIKAGQTATHQITVRVKDPVPQTPAGSSDPARYDLVMTNVYGDAVNIRLPGSPQKTIESAAGTLPNTGPGTTLMIAGAIVIIAGYFFGRARLLSEESTIAVQEMAGV